MGGRVGNRGWPFLELGQGKKKDAMRAKGKSDTKDPQKAPTKRRVEVQSGAGSKTKKVILAFCLSGAQRKGGGCRMGTERRKWPESKSMVKEWGTVDAGKRKSLRSRNVSTGTCSARCGLGWALSFGRETRL